MWDSLQSYRKDWKVLDLGWGSSSIEGGGCCVTILQTLIYWIDLECWFNGTSLGHLPADQKPVTTLCKHLMETYLVSPNFNVNLILAGFLLCQILFISLCQTRYCSSSISWHEVGMNAASCALANSTEMWLCLHLLGGKFVLHGDHTRW